MFGFGLERHAGGFAEADEGFLSEIQTFAMPMKDSPAAAQLAATERQSDHRAFFDFFARDPGSGDPCREICAFDIWIWDKQIGMYETYRAMD